MKLSKVVKRSRRDPFADSQKHAMDIELQRVLREYEDARVRADKGLPHRSGPWLVRDGVSRVLFEAWSDRVEAHWKLEYRDADASVWFYGDPTKMHEAVAGWFRAMLQEALRAIVADVVEHIVFSGSPRYQISTGLKEPDFALYHEDNTRSASASLVGEVAYENESLTKLVREVSAWVTGPNAARMCIGVKIVKPRGAQRQATLTLVTQMRGQPAPVTLAFGRGSRCTRAGLPAYQLAVPVDAIYDGAPRPAGTQPGAAVSLDLWSLRRRVQRELR